MEIDPWHTSTTSFRPQEVATCLQEEALCSLKCERYNIGFHDTNSYPVHFFDKGCFLFGGM